MTITKYGKAGKKAFNADMSVHGKLADNIKTDIMQNKGKVPRTDTVKLTDLLKIFNSHGARDDLTISHFNKALDNDGTIVDKQEHKESINSQIRDKEVLNNVKHKVDSIDGIGNKQEIDNDIDKTIENGEAIKDKMQAVEAKITKDINGKEVRESYSDDDMYMLNGGDNRLINIQSLVESIARPGGY